RTTEQLHADRQPVGREARRHAQSRKTSNSTELTVRAALRLVDDRRLASHRRIDDRVEAIGVEKRYDEIARGDALRERPFVGVARARAIRLAPTQRGLELRVLETEIENFAERLHGRVRHRRQEVREVWLELEVDHTSGADHRIEVRNGDVDDFRTARLHLVDRRANYAGAFGVVGLVAEMCGEYAQSFATERRRVESVDELG